MSTKLSPILIRSVFLAGLACGSILSNTRVADAQTSASIVRIEERWELAIRQADEQTNAPQVLMHFSPFGGSSEFHFEVDLNHASRPEYRPGGIQVRAMQGEQVLNQVRLLDDQRLNTQSEVLSWTQIAQKQSGGWAFAIGFGNSTTWGTFGGPATIVSLPPVDAPLAYSPQQSLASSGVIYARNRVERLTLCSVRYYNELGQFVDIPVGQSVQ